MFLGLAIMGTVSSLKRSDLYKLLAVKMTGVKCQN